MPNHCRNKMTVFGPEKDIASFVQKTEGDMPKWRIEPFDRRTGRNEHDPPHHSILAFHALVPLPEGSYGPGVEYDPHGHTAERETWGVKWGAYDESIAHRAPGMVTYHFTTAWGVPTRWLEAVSRLYPRLTFALSYAEESPSHGCLIVRRGEVTVVAEAQGGGPTYPKDATEAEESAWQIEHDAWEEYYYRRHARWVAGLR